MSSDELTIEHRREAKAGAFIVSRAGRQLGELFYTLEGEVAVVEHTEVDEELRGLGVAKRLVLAAVEWARAENKKLAPICKYTKHVFATHPELEDVFASVRSLGRR